MSNCVPRNEWRQHWTIFATLIHRIPRVYYPSRQPCRLNRILFSRGRPGVCQCHYPASICEDGLGSRVDCDKSKWRTTDILIPHERAITLLLRYQQWLVSDTPFPSKICAQSDPFPFEKRRLWHISAYNVSTVRNSEKSSIMTNINSTTRFPTSYRWSAYVTPKSPKGWLKKRFFRFFLSKSQWLIVSSAVNLVRRWVS